MDRGAHLGKDEGLLRKAGEGGAGKADLGAGKRKAGDRAENNEPAQNNRDSLA